MGFYEIGKSAFWKGLAGHQDTRRQERQYFEDNEKEGREGVMGIKTIGYEREHLGDEVRV